MQGAVDACAASHALTAYIYYTASSHIQSCLDQLSIEI